MCQKMLFVLVCLVVFLKSSVHTGHGVNKCEHGCLTACVLSSLSLVGQ